MIIYKMQNKINGKIYIGQTVRTLEERTKEHCSHRTIAIDKALKKYGKDNFEINIIDDAKTIDELNDKEIFWINFYKCCVPNGYNQCKGGENTMGYHHKEKSKKAMSEKKSVMYIGENNPFYGKKHTQQSKDKMSKSRKGRIITEEWRKNLSKASTTKVKVVNLDTKEVFNSVKEASDKYNIADTHISRVCKKKRKSTGGYRWMYYDEYMTIPCQSQKETSLKV